MPHPALARTVHRPWPLPRGAWVLSMRWEDLLFAHRSADPQAVQALLPAGLELDTFEGRAWVGVVPFRMTGVRVRALPPFPGTSTFPELNVRTYVRHGRRPGVWFFSLDAASGVAVRAARGCFRLPYFRARMACTREESSVDYASRRTHRRAPEAKFRARYAPEGQPFRAAPGSFEHWLTERYCLYAADGRGRILRGEIQHEQWQLQRATAEIAEDTMAAAAGLALADGAPHLLFSRGIDVVAWKPAVADPW